MPATAKTQTIGDQQVNTAEFTGYTYQQMFTAIMEALRNKTLRPSATAETVSIAIALAEAGDLEVGESISWEEYESGTGVGGNTAILRDAGSSGARPIDDGGSVFHVGSAGLYLDARNMRDVDPAVFGVVYGSPDDQVIKLQKASDYAEATGKQFVQSGNITLKSNWYIGNLNFRRANGIFEIVSDATFTQRGAASRNNEGVILSKSAGAAGYGLAAIELTIIGGFYATFSRPVTNGPLAGVLLENVKHIKGDTISVVTAEGQNTSKTPLDFYTNVQNIELDSVYIETDCGTTGVGGFWIRNSSLTEQTGNIKISNLVVKHKGADEAVAVFNFANAAEIKNVKFGKVTIDTEASGQALSVMNKFSGSPGIVDDVTFDDVTISVTGSSANMFVVKSENCEPVYSKLRINLNDLTGASGSLYGVRAISNNNEVTRIANLIVNVNATPPAGNLDLISGLFEVDNTTVKSTNGAAVRRVARAFKALRNCSVDCDYTDTALSIGDEVSGNVRGKMEGIQDFKGNHILDVSGRSGTYWFLHSAATMGVRLPKYIRYDADVTVQSGAVSDTIANIVSANFTATNDVPMRIKENIDNTLHDITIGNDFNGGSVSLVEYDSVNNLASGMVRRTKALTV